MGVYVCINACKHNVCDTVHVCICVCARVCVTHVCVCLCVCVFVCVCTKTLTVIYVSILCRPMNVGVMWAIFTMSL